MTGNVKDFLPYWDALQKGTRLPESPCPGRYRLPARRTESMEGRPPPKSWPVGIWKDSDDGKRRVLIGPRRLLIEDSAETGDAYLEFSSQGWHACIAVPREQYDAVMQGGSWPDESEAVTKLHNQPPPDDSFESLRDAIENLRIEAGRLIGAGAAKDKATVDQAADVANMLTTLWGRTDKARTKEKEPFLEGGRRVDARWKPVLTAAEVYRELKAKVISPWLDAERTRQEAARFQALTTGVSESDAPQVKPVAGTRGRPVSQRGVKSAKITDVMKLLAVFQTNAKLIAVLQDLADASARQGVKLDGMEIVEERKAT